MTPKRLNVNNNNNDDLFINIFEANCYLQVKSKKKELLKPIYNSFRLKKTIFKHTNNNNNGKTKVIKLQ